MTASTNNNGGKGALKLQQLGRRVGRQQLLESLSLTVQPGEILALLGPSGCGKSTTLRLLAGLDPASSGQILLGDDDITATPPADRGVALVFQSYALYPHLSVERNLSLGPELRGTRPELIKEEINRVLDLLQLQDLRHRKPAGLSGGQRQRVALGRALLRRPRLMLLDEPMSNLDAKLREELRAELQHILRSIGAPVIYVTHDQHEAMGLADRIAVLERGQLQQVGSAEELYRRPANSFVAGFLGNPSINLLSLRPGQLIGLRPEQLRLAHLALPNRNGSQPQRPAHNPRVARRPLVAPSQQCQRPTQSDASQQRHAGRWAATWSPPGGAMEPRRSTQLR